MLRRELILRREAVSTVISTVLALLISISTIGAILYTGASYVNYIESKKETQNIISQFNNLADGIEELSYSVSGDKKSACLSISEGNLKMNKYDFDRTVLMYSYDNTVDFYVLELDNKDNQFEIHIVGGDIEPNNFRIRQINDNGLIDAVDIPFSYSAPDITLNTGIFSDKMVIYVKDSTDTKLQGCIWLFDTNSLVFSNSDSGENYNLILERADILYESTGTVQIKRVSIINANDVYCGVRLFQTKTNETVSYSRSTQWIYLTNRGSIAQEIDKVYNLKIQFHNGYDQKLIEYYNTSYYSDPGTLFNISAADSSGKTLYYTYPNGADNGIWFTLMHSIIEFDFFI